jgi:hypothetical protein
VIRRNPSFAHGVIPWSNFASLAEMHCFMTNDSEDTPAAPGTLSKLTIET